MTTHNNQSTEIHELVADRLPNLGEVTPPIVDLDMGEAS